MALQDVLAGSDNTDVFYAKKDRVTPVILNLGDQQKVRLKVVIKSLDGEVIDRKEFNDILLEEGRTIKKLPSFRLKLSEEGYYIFEYYVLRG